MSKKFFVKNGVWTIGEFDALPAGLFVRKIDASGRVYIHPYGSDQVIIQGMPTEFEDADGNHYASLAALKAATDNFFISTVTRKIKAGTPLNAVAASKVLTVSGVPSEGKVVTLSGKTYKWRDAIDAGGAAICTLTFTGNAQNGEFVVVGDKAYGFKTALSANPTVANEVLIGASASESIDNLILACNAGAGAGVKYGTGTVAHPDFIGSKVDADKFRVTYKTVGFAGNGKDTTTTCANATWSDAASHGGWDAQAPNDVKIGASAEISIDNLVAAITKAEGEGTLYGTGTVANVYSTAVKASASTMTATSKIKGVVGNDLDIAENDANTSWAGGATKLSGGVDGTVGGIYDEYVDASYRYMAIADNGIHDANWIKSAAVPA